MNGKESISQSFERAARQVEELTADGVLGFFDRFEATEIIAMQDGAPPFNLLSVFVAEDGGGEPLAGLKSLGERLRCKEMRGWTFGVYRYEIACAEMTEHLKNYASAEAWQPSSKRLDLSVDLARPAQFVPIDSIGHVPLNSVLKNNFWNGSHVIELIDIKKTKFAEFYNDPSLLKIVAALIEEVTPIRISGLSDRLGNVLVQVPITVIMASFGQRRDSDELFVDVAWHKRATPRALRASCEVGFDGIVSAFAVAEVTSGQTDIPMQHTDRAFQSRLWDPVTGVLLAAAGPSAFMRQFSMNTSIGLQEPRTFMVPQADGSLREQEVAIMSPEGNTAIIGKAPINGLEWMDRRLYQADIQTARAERRLIPYGPHLGDPSAEHQRALEDIRNLIRLHGTKAVWLWDPFLAADDLLKTLFYCPTAGSDLRALSAGSRITEETENGASKFEWIKAQHDRLELAKGNANALRLEFRVKIGPKGWAFHDRFIIFAHASGGALAWSLGTSVNSLGRQHHILQQVSDGQMIADAFEELWLALDEPAHIIWRTP